MTDLTNVRHPPSKKTCILPRHEQGDYSHEIQDESSLIYLVRIRLFL